MARARLLSRTLGSSRKFHAVAELAGNLGEFCQVLFPLLVVNSDDFGRSKGDAFTVKHLVFPSSPRTLDDFNQALNILAQSGLIDRYQVEGDIYIQINKFDEHQSGLHKRTTSKFPECPGNSGSFPLNRTELNRTEQKGKGARETRTAAAPDGRSKRPIFSGQRVTVFEWQFDDCIQTLGPDADAFDLHEWFFVLDKHAVDRGLVIPKRDGGAWLQQQLVSEAQRRGLNLRLALPVRAQYGKQSTRLAAAMSNIKAEGA